MGSESIAVNRLTKFSTEDVGEVGGLVAHNQWRGRGTADGGYEFPSLFLARELRKLGIAPSGEVKYITTKEMCAASWSYFQEFEFAKTKKYVSRNVIGLIPGANTDEYVVIGAHYDHEGLGELSGELRGAKGKIYPGADDNGSGTVALLEVAEAFSELAKHGVKPKRGVLFCFLGAEEWGEIGSEHFIKTLPAGIELKNIVGYVNMDMVGRNDPKELFVLCAPAPMPKDGAGKCGELYDIAEKVNETLKLEFKISHKDTEDGFERTDGWPFYKADRGTQGRIPVWELFTGEHPDYHTPKDTVDKIDYKKLERVAKMAYGIVRYLAEMDGKPSYK